MMQYVFAVSAATFFGCANHGIHQAMTHVDEHGITAISYPENHRVAFLKRNSEVEYLCAGSGIDVASNTLSGLSLGSLGIGPVDGVSENSERVESSLGGRDPVVLIAREILFRTCETAMNNELSSGEALKLYQTALETLQIIAKVHNNAGTQTGQSAPFVLPTPQGANNGLDDNDNQADDTYDAQ